MSSSAGDGRRRGAGRNARPGRDGDPRRTQRGDRSTARRSGEGRGKPNAEGRTSERRREHRADATPVRKNTARSTARNTAAAPERSRRPAEPALPDGLDIGMLDRSVRTELRTLTKLNAEVVGAHLVAAGLCLDTDPQRALAHARAARSRASRLAVVREAVGVAAYAAQEWTEAITELRTARRISGDPRNLALIADCERALGRPGQAVRLLNDPGVPRLDGETRAELLIVVAGARRDLGQVDAALAVLARGGLDREHPRPGAMRLWYAYADALEAAGRVDDAASWFAASAGLDVEGDTDAAERAAALL